MARLSPIIQELSRSRAAVAQHRRNRLSLERVASTRSRRGLDWMNFFMADVQVGFGAFVAFYLADLNWSQENVGFALTLGRIVGALWLVPGGALADAVRWKRGLAAVGILMVAAAALILALFPSFAFVMVAEVLHGLTGGIIGPAIASISLGLVGRRAMSSRVGRNHRFDAAGNAITALAMGALGSYLTTSAIFLAAALLTIPALVALAFIRGEEIDYARARNAAKADERPSFRTILALGKNRQLLWFTCCAALFQFADASMLPLVSEDVGRAQIVQSSMLMSGLIVAPQIVVAILAPWIGYFSELWGRRPLLLIGFAVQVIRAVLFVFVTDPVLLIAVQLLDGMSGAVLSVLTVVIIADLTAGTGRFNLARGAVGLVAAIAASVSTFATGFLAQEAGHLAAFLGMAAVAALGALAVRFLLGETKPAKYEDEEDRTKT